MRRRTIALVLLVCLMLSAASCGKTPEASVVQTSPTVATDGTTRLPQSFMEDAYVEIELCAEAGTTYTFKYDSDIFAYTGQGGNFYLIGSDPTKCFLHVVIQDQNSDAFDTAKQSLDGKITKEFTLDSGRKAFIYSTDDANNIHVVYDASGITPSGHGLINLYIGAVDTWPYSAEQIANMADKGFAA